MMPEMSTRPGHPPRLRAWDYSTPGIYFVTFRAGLGSPPLSRLEANEVVLTPAGQIVEECWLQLPQRFDLQLDVCVIMPDHVHAIIQLSGDDPGMKPSLQGFRPLMSDPSAVLGKVIRSWKARSTHEIRTRGAPTFSWQERFYERVVRGRAEMERIRQYILENPGRRSC